MGVNLEGCMTCCNGGGSCGIYGDDGVRVEGQAIVA